MRFIEQNWGSCKLFYKEVYDEVKHKIPDEVFRQAYNDVIRNAYMGDKLRYYSLVWVFKNFWIN